MHDHSSAIHDSGPDSPGRIPREVVAALAGAEAGAGIGLVGFGGTLMAPLALAACGALTGPLLALGVRRVRLALFARLLRAQLRAGARVGPNQG